MPPKRKAAPKKEESPPPPESESEPELSSEREPESPKPKKSKPGPKPRVAVKAKVAPTPAPKKAKATTPVKKQSVRKGAKRGAQAEVMAEKPPPAPSPPEKVEKVSKQVVVEKPTKLVERVIKKVVIEHCKQCQSFKRTAGKLEGLLKKSIPDLEVTTNPEKPRKGIFEVRDSEGNVFISLQGLTRPFKKMKDLNLEETAGEVVAKIS